MTAFLNALNCWEDGAQAIDAFKRHWWNGEPTVIAHSRKQQGQLAEEEVLQLKNFCESFETKFMPEGSAFGLAFNCLQAGIGRRLTESEGEFLASQLVSIVAGISNGVLATSYLATWDHQSGSPFPTDAKQALERCFQHYHRAWDLFTRQIGDKANHPTAKADPDRATAILDRFQEAFIQDSAQNERPEWWTESNWLLVRRLISSLLGDADSALKQDSDRPREPNRVQMLLVVTDSENEQQGITAPVETAAYDEFRYSAYLDPIALGPTLLDEEMLTSLRMVTRICRPELSRSNASLRISLPTISQGKPFGILSGPSAGGLVTIAACATAQGARLNRDVSASFTVGLRNPNPSTETQSSGVMSLADSNAFLREPESSLTRDDIVFGPVGATGIEAKLLAANRTPPLATIYLHGDQRSGPKGHEHPWKDWVPQLEHSPDFHLGIRSVGTQKSYAEENTSPHQASPSLADLIHEMTGDERMEQVLTKHADAVFAEWDQIKNATDKSPHSLWDEQDEHRLDHYVWPNYRIELPETEEQRSKRMLEHQEPPSEPVPGADTEREPELLRRLVNGNKFLVVYDNAGAGKTVFSWRLRTDAASVAIRRAVFEGHAPLVVRCDGEWPKDSESRRYLTLAERLQRELAAVIPNPDEQVDVVDYALKHRRAIVIVDGFDQFSEAERSHVVDLLLHDKTARDQCYWIITSRVHTIDALRHTLFIDRDWDRVRIDPFDKKQQDRYFNELGERWLQTVSNRDAMSELLKLPMVLRLIRRLIEDTPPGHSPPVFHTLSELFVRCAQALLDRAIRTSQQKLEVAGLAHGDLKPSEQMPMLKQALATLAFQMMVDQNYNALLDDGQDHAIQSYQENAEDRFCYELNQRVEEPGLTRTRRNNAERDLDARQAAWRWALAVLKEIELNHRSVTEAYRPERIAFRSRKMLECYAALYLVQYANAGDLDAIRQLLGDEQWDACWGLAIQMPQSEVVPAVVEQTFAALFEVPAHHPRPTEHMFHAWQLMKRDPERYPGLEATLHSYRQQFLDVLFGTDENRAERAAEVITPEDFEKHLAALSSSSSPLPLGEEPGVSAAVSRRSAPSAAWVTRIRQTYASRPTYAVISDATKPEKFRQEASANTRARHYTLPDKLTFLMGASPEDTSAYDEEKHDKSSKNTWWNEQQIDAFQMATCCITRAQYRLFCKHRGQPKLGATYDPTTDSYGASRYSPDEDCPMIEVNWWDAFCFALWLGEEYHLPDERQWEGAAWGGIDREKHPSYVISVEPYTAAFTSNEVNHDGNHPIEGEKKSGYAERTLPVRWDNQRWRIPLSEPQPNVLPSAYKANGFGLWHVNGNIYEWCKSGWPDDTLAGALSALDAKEKSIDRENVNTRTRRVVRGGSWTSTPGTPALPSGTGSMPRTETSTWGFVSPGLFNHHSLLSLLSLLPSLPLSFPSSTLRHAQRGARVEISP